MILSFRVISRYSGALDDMMTQVCQDVNNQVFLSRVYFLSLLGLQGYDVKTLLQRSSFSEIIYKRVYNRISTYDFPSFVTSLCEEK